MRIAFKTPMNWIDVEIQNGSLTKRVVEYRFNPSWETLSILKKIECEISCNPTLASVLRAMGSHAVLWIGTCQGIVAPMDMQPEGWTYGSGQAYEAENFWQWHPDPRSAEQLVKESNKFLTDPITALLGESEGIFKSLVPFQMARNQGQIIAVEAIPISRLPGLVKKDIDWVFELSRD